MQIGKLPLQLNMIMVRARDIARATSPGTTQIQRFMHRSDHVRMLAHAQVIVGTPDRHQRPVAPVQMRRTRKIAGVPLQIGEHPIVALTVKAIEVLSKEGFVVHWVPLLTERYRHNPENNAVVAGMITYITP